MTGIFRAVSFVPVYLKPVNLFVVSYFLVALTSLDQYIPLDSAGVIVGAAALCFVLPLPTGFRTSGRYGWLTLLVSILCYLMPVQTLLYFAIAFALVFIREQAYGRTCILFPAVLILMSPVLEYLANTFSFPIRLELTALAARLLDFTGTGATAEGNLIIFNGNEFSVDPACMGLNMITVSLLTGIILLAFYQQKANRQLRTSVVILYLLVLLVLNIVANLFRIILLVFFTITPGSIAHDIAGLGCLLVYVFLPAKQLSSFIVRKAGHPASQTERGQSRALSRHGIFVQLGLLGLVIFLSWRVKVTDTFHDFPTAVDISVPGYNVTSPTKGIIKIENSDALVYLKYIRGFYDTDHNPMICWVGSGYQFERIVVEKIGDHELFTARLNNGKEILYSAWWYDNGEVHTTSQYRWRTELLCGSRNFVLVNVTCSDRNGLIKAIKNIQDGKLLTRVLESKKTDQKSPA